MAVNAAPYNKGIRVLVFGPPFSQSLDRGSGGGIGGYTRNMEVYLHHLGSETVQLTPLFHTVRGQFTGFKALFPVRLAIELWRAIFAIIRHRPHVVHCLARYREAIPREYLLATLCWMFRVPLVYDVKAGAFIDAYNHNGRTYRFLVDRVVARSAALLVEGQAYLPFIREKFGLEATYFPNFVPDAEVPECVPERLTGQLLRVLFVGFCHPDKGVYEVVNGCRKLAEQGIAIRLTMIGSEAPEFTTFFESLPPLAGFTCARLGRQDHAHVRASMLLHDVFCFPSQHAGEGHSNAITEAMMSGMVIASSRVGFLEAVIEDRGGYFFENHSVDSVAATLLEIRTNPQQARERAQFAHEKVREYFTASVARARIGQVYHSVLSNR